MLDENTLTLGQIDGSRSDIYAIAGEIEALKTQLARLPSREYLCRIVLTATASVWALIAAVALWLR